MDVVQLREEGVRQGREEGDQPYQGYDLKEHISKWYFSGTVDQGYDLKAQVVAGILSLFGKMSTSFHSFSSHSSRNESRMRK